jgi:putative membrane protein
MIRGYSDHAANERTFLAWVRTGIAVIGFGFVIEKFNLFVLANSISASTEVTSQLVEHLSGAIGRYEGFVAMLAGLAVVLIATVRFMLIDRKLDDLAMHSAGSAWSELFLSGTLVLLIVFFSGFIVLS